MDIVKFIELKKIIKYNTVQVFLNVQLKWKRFSYRTSCRVQYFELFAVS